MTLEEAIAAQASWVPIWVAILTMVGIVAPVVLLFWRQTRMVGVVAILAQIVAGLGVQWLFDRYGYVGIIALPHVVLWTPLVAYLVSRARGAGMLRVPRLVVIGLATVLSISLVFDYASVIRYYSGASA